MNFIYPNEVVTWDILVVAHLYVSGIVAGSFFIATLYKIFKVEPLKPVFRLSILTSLAFLIANNPPLVSHLGHPERAFETLATPHFTSAMSLYGFFASSLGVTLVLIILYEYRKDLVNLAHESGLKRTFYKILTLGDYDISEEAIKKDRRVVYYLTWIAFIIVVLLYSFEGIKISVKANPWWDNALMPITFFLSGIISGIAVVLMTYLLRKERDQECMKTIASLLLIFLVSTLFFEYLKLTHYGYLSGGSFEPLGELILGEIFFSYFIIQIGLGGILPVVIIASTRTLSSGSRITYALSSALVLLGAFTMQWNTMIGGQLFSKSQRGFLSYHVQVLSLEGLLTILFLVLPFLILLILVRVFPLESMQNNLDTELKPDVR